MHTHVITRATSPRTLEPRVIDLDQWRVKYKAKRAQELNEDGGHPVVERKPPAVLLRNTEASIESAVRDFARKVGANACEAAAAVACAIKMFRAGHSGNRAAAAGRERATQLAWGTVRGPEVA